MKNLTRKLFAAVALLAVLAMAGYAVAPSVYAAVNRSLPTANSDGTASQSPTRTGTYLEAYTIPLFAGPWAFADEGSLYVITNATTATGIAGHAAPVVADTDTKALLHIFNGSSTKRIYPLYCQLEVTAAGTAGTIHYTTIYIDDKGSTARSSGGTAITPVNANAEVSSATGATVHFGAVVTAMTSSRKVGQQIVREVIPVVQDTVYMDFTGQAVPKSALTTAGTATNHAFQRFAPVVIGPGGNLNISQIRPSQSAAASYQFECAYLER